ncbi:sensor histidine kinase [Azospirillum rugosum]|uniref:histidine kinase n=1 Tax=Azospirillum rugosum TaxID=416170 RepID=A0ABS4SN89_9PROT|nr:HAMP domain-containing sensor histidine kinase [Azospirillum rugosum]MBP2293543.1 signal transduction histidine kinase [Azospirillum rugosum]MDQ0529222.1 signal transduction histidine kinase [Azospirillum rugosum]
MPARLRAALAVPLLLLVLLGIGAPTAARAEAGAENGNGVLFISSFSLTVSWTEAMLDAAREELAARGDPVNLYVELLDRVRFPDRPDDKAWAEFLRVKYRDVRPRAIIADGAPAIQFVAAHGRSLFGDAPVVGIFPNFDNLGDAGTAVAVRVTTGPHVDQTVEMALAQNPAATRLVIVSDDTAPSHHLARIVRTALARNPGRPLEVGHLHDLTVGELEDRVAALAPGSVVLYTHVTVDRTGRQYRPDAVAARLAQVSTAPVYVLFDSDIGTGVGTGAVGGYVNDSGIAGRVATRAALQLLTDGAPDRAEPAEERYSSQPVVDWRQLRRWGIDERTLPPGTEVRFRQPSILEAHFAEAMIGLVFIAVLAILLGLVFVLFVQRGRHAHALSEANSRLEERVALRTRDIERALAGEQMARQRLRTFLDMATHEFKTPLAVIDSSVQMLERLVPTEREGVGSRLALIRRSVRRVIDLIETCLAGDRVDEELPVKIAAFAPATMVQRVVDRQRSLGSAIVADIAGLPDTCTADPDLLGIALDVLLDNARRYGPASSSPGAAIALTARQEGAALVLSVADRGPGIPEEEAERVFEKYYRGTHSAGVPGTGIGLTLVRTIADLHGGTVTHHPRDGGGAVFVLSVPVEWERRAGSVERRLSAL